MATTIKDTNKRDIKIKGATAIGGKFYDEGIETNLIALIEKAYPDGAAFDLTITAKSEEEIDLDDNADEEGNEE